MKELIRINSTKYYEIYEIKIPQNQTCHFILITDLLSVRSAGDGDVTGSSIFLSTTSTSRNPRSIAAGIEIDSPERGSTTYLPASWLMIPDQASRTVLHHCVSRQTRTHKSSV